MNISQIDDNLANCVVDGTDITWIHWTDKIFSVHGIFYDEEEKLFMRVPKEISEATLNPKLHPLVRMTSGGRIRFVTDSEYISIKASLPYFSPIPSMSITTTHGFSVYADGLYRNRYSPSFNKFIEAGEPDRNKRIFFTERKFIDSGKKDRLIEIYFPLYGGVSDIYIGVDPGSTSIPAPCYKITKPLVFYGSSITQGACVTRPGNDYLSMLARMLDADYINLGFSGNGNAEEPMIEYLSSIDASLFAFDYNMYQSKKDRVLPPYYSIYEKIRKKHPDSLILMHDKPGCDYEPYPEREKIINDAYQKALASGDKLVGFISAYDFFGDGNRDSCMVDVSHPSDIGAMRMANAIYSAIKQITERKI